MASLELLNIRKRYGELDILKGIDISVDAGEFLVLVGPSGCGKSTLLNMIAGLDTVSEGEIRIGGRRVNDLHPSERDIAMVFQSYALYPNMSVKDNIAFGMEMRKVPKPEREQAVKEVSRTLQIDHLLDRRPAQLSGGQRQRVAIGRAIVREPKAFLFDEPLSNLDAALRVQMRLEIAQLHESLTTTMIYVTHDQVEAMTLADKIVVLNAGNIEQAGSPLELYHHPVNLFVAGFIGSPKMNFLATQVRTAGPDGVTVTLPGGRDVRDPVAAGSLKVGDKATLGVRPEHLKPAADGELVGNVIVAERLGGETYLYIRSAEEPLFVVQADGDIPTRVHDRVAVRIDPETCHLFDAGGRSLQRLRRHPLADTLQAAQRAS
jgi:multiple sugar transport system ATP-binding protein